MMFIVVRYSAEVILFHTRRKRYLITIFTPLCWYPLNLLPMPFVKTTSLPLLLMYCYALSHFATTLSRISVLWYRTDRCSVHAYYLIHALITHFCYYAMMGTVFHLMTDTVWCCCASDYGVYAQRACHYLIFITVQDSDTTLPFWYSFWYDILLLMICITVVTTITHTIFLLYSCMIHCYLLYADDMMWYIIICSMCILIRYVYHWPCDVMIYILFIIWCDIYTMMMILLYMYILDILYDVLYLRVFWSRALYLHDVCLLIIPYIRVSIPQWCGILLFYYILRYLFSDHSLVATTTLPCTCIDVCVLLFYDFNAWSLRTFCSVITVHY